MSRLQSPTATLKPPSQQLLAPAAVPVAKAVSFPEEVKREKRPGSLSPSPSPKRSNTSQASKKRKKPGAVSHPYYYTRINSH